MSRARSAEFTGRKYDYTPRNLFEERYVHYVSTIEAERIRNQVTLTALKGLITRLGGLREGRKAIVLISEGFTNSLPPQVQDQIATCNGGPCGNQPRPRPDPIGGQSGRCRRAWTRRTSSSDAICLSDIRSVYELANRYNTAIYAVDPRGLAAFEFDLSTAGQANVSLTKDSAMLDSTMDTLRILADETDGRAIVNSNDLDRGLRQIVRDSSAYYLLGYTSTLHQPDGKFHKINVRVKRPGLQVRARPGYLALTAVEAERATEHTKKAGPPPRSPKRSATLAATQQRRKSDPHAGSACRPARTARRRSPSCGIRRPAVPGVRRETAGECVADGRRGEFGSVLRQRGDRAGPGRVRGAARCQIDLEIAVEDAAAEVLDRETRKIVVPSLGLGL